MNLKEIQEKDGLLEKNDNIRFTLLKILERTLLPLQRRWLVYQTNECLRERVLTA